MTSPQVGRIVVGVSGTLANLAAVRVAVDLARRCSAPLLAVHAWLPVGGEIAYRRGPCPPLLAIWRQQARNTLNGAFLDSFGAVPSDIAVECVIVRGEPGPALVAAARYRDDLLVVGSGRRGLLAGVRRRSVNRFCITHSAGPTLAVPPPAMFSELPRRLSRLDYLPPSPAAVRGSARPAGREPRPGSSD